MKYLIMCEGPNELAVIQLLLDQNRLIISTDDLIGLRPYHARQLTSAVVKGELSIYLGNFEIWRVGDKLNETLKIPSEYRNRVISVKKYCTKPELEMLLIISKELEKEYEKTKSSVSPKSFCKANVRYNRQKYDNSTAFYRNYFENNIEDLVDAIKRYKQIKGKHQKDELYLADIVR